MNKFLKSAVERFDKIKNKDFLINPISAIDSEIMVELSQILKKKGITDIFEILKSYKELKDQEILDQLMQWNIDNPTGPKKQNRNRDEEIIEDVEQQSYPPFIKMGSLILKIYDLQSLELYERLDEEGNYRYGIIINPTPENAKSIPPHSNYKIEFFAEENRNDILYKLESACQDLGTDFIDLMNNGNQ